MAASSFTRMAACAAAQTVRSLPPCSAAASVFWNSSNFAALRTSTSCPNLSLHIKYSQQIRALATGTASETKIRTIKVGDKLPDADLSFLDKEGNVQTVKVSDLTKGKKVVIFAVPGAFTPTCSSKHVPGFIEKSGELKSKGVDVIACVSVNDVFVMRAWGEDLGVEDKVLLLSDGNGNFTSALGVSMDLSDKPQGLGVRSRRYSLLAEDGIVKILNLEEGGSFNSSSAEDLLKAL